MPAKKGATSKKKTALDYFKDLNDHTKPRKQQSAIKWFQSQKRPHKYLFNTPKGFYWKTSMEECAIILHKWIDEPKVLRHFVWVASELNVPGCGYAFQKLVEQGKKIVPLLIRIKAHDVNEDEREIIHEILSAIEDDQFESDDVVEWTGLLWSGSESSGHRALRFIDRNFDELVAKLPDGDTKWYQLIAILDWYRRTSAREKDVDIENISKRLLRKIRNKNLKSKSDDPHYWFQFILSSGEPSLRHEAIKWYTKNLAKINLPANHSYWWNILSSGGTPIPGYEIKDPDALERLQNKIINKLARVNNRDDWLKYSGIVHNTDMQVRANRWLIRNFSDLWKPTNGKWFELLQSVRQQQEKYDASLQKSSKVLEKKILHLQPLPRWRKFEKWYRYVWDWEHPYLVYRSLEWMSKHTGKIEKSYVYAILDVVKRVREKQIFTTDQTPVLDILEKKLAKN